MAIYSCNSKNSIKENALTPNNTVSSDNDKQMNQLDYLLIGDSIYVKKKGIVPQFSYKFNIDSSKQLLKSIIIYSDNIKVQEIVANKEMWNNGNVEKFQLIDWNFDGFKDITVLYNCGSGGCAYWIWNYSENDGKYYYNSELSEKLGLEIDITSKYIIKHYKAGYSEEWWDSLQYVNNELKFIKGLYRERYRDSAGNFWEKNSRSKMINNKLVTTIDSLIIQEK